MSDTQISDEIIKPTINKQVRPKVSALLHLQKFTQEKDVTTKLTFKKGNTVIDMDTKISKWLQWQDNSESNATTVKNQYYGTRGAENYCSALVLDGLDDWRAPSREELLSIVDSTKTGAKIKSAFEYTSASQYATGEVNYNSEGMYFVDFSNGSQGYNSIYEANSDNDYKVRCVRDIMSGIDIVPTQFAFTDNLTASELNTAYESNSVTIGGLTPLAKSKVIITGGEYKIGDSAWTNTTGEISNGQTIKVRGTTPTTIGIRQNVTLTIGGISDIFTIINQPSRTGNIVTDTTTNLQWQDDSAVTTNAQNWNNAITYCSNLTLDSYSDWRLPTANEMENINADIRTKFINTVWGGYWSATQYAYHEPQAHIRGISDNYYTWWYKSDSYRVSCVRGGN